MKNILLQISTVLFGVVLTILIQRYLQNTDLTISLHSSDIIVEKKSMIEDVVITYKGNELNQLTKSIFKYKNTGKTPFLEKDLVSPLTIHLDKAILSTKIDSTIPQGLNPTIMSTNNTITVKLNLLNPDDEIIFSALTDGVITDFSVDSRVVGVKEINKIVMAPQSDVDDKKGIAYYVVWILFSLCIIGLFPIFKDYKIERKYRKLAKIEQIDFSSLKMAADYSNFIKNNLSFFDSKTKNKLVKFVETYKIHGNEFLSPESREIINSVLLEEIKSNNSSLGALILILFIMFFSAAYLFDLMKYIKL